MEDAQGWPDGEGERGTPGRATSMSNRTEARAGLLRLQKQVSNPARVWLEVARDTELRQWAGRLEQPRGRRVYSVGIRASCKG